jgi:hypothetical protein
LGVLAIGFFIVGPVTEEVTSHVLSLGLYRVRWVLAFVDMIVFLVVMVKVVCRSTKSDHDPWRPTPIGQPRFSPRFDFDDHYDEDYDEDYDDTPGYGQPRKGHISAEAYAARSERERRDAAQKARWDRAEREAARPRREAEQFHREQRIRQAKLDKDRRREYNRTHEWGHR